MILQSKMARMLAVGGLLGMVGMSAWATGHTPAATNDVPSLQAPGGRAKWTPVSFNGVDGQTALSLLSSKAVISTQGMDATLQVVSVNGYRVNELNKEYWACYVNGAMVEVPADEVITRSTDRIEWKVARY